MIDRKGNCLRQAFSAICPATCCMRYFAFTLWIVIRVFPRESAARAVFSVRSSIVAWTMGAEYT